ncbi:MAG: fibronectin type III domain-containing protein, partial [Candidatus Neomarinimicrobiota bacterium]
MVKRRQLISINTRQRYRLPLAGLVHSLLLAGTLTAQVTLSLPHIRVAAGDSTAVVPVVLVNELDEVGGLQVDLYQPLAGPTLDTILTTTYTAGWTVSPTPTNRPGLTRLLLFDPQGSNIAPGTGPVMELVYTWPPDSTYSAYIHLEVAALSVSDAVGDELPSVGRPGSLGIGALVTLAADTISADADDTVEMTIAMENNAPLADISLGLTWERRWLNLVEASATTRSRALSIEVKDDDSGARLDLAAVDSSYLAIDTGAVVTLQFAISREAPAGDIPISITADRLKLPDGQRAALTGTGPGLVRVYPGHLAPPSGLTAISSEDSRVLLSWTAPAWTGDGLGSPTGYLLYRHGAPDFPDDSLHRTVAVATESYLDTAVVNGDTYYYRVTAMYGDSLESAYTWPVWATPEAPQVLAIGSVRATAGEWMDIPILMENAHPVAGLRFKVTVEPDIPLNDLEIVLGSRVPPDWMVVLSRDTVSRALEIAALSPRLTLIPAGSGEVLHLRAETPSGHSLEAELRLSD